MSRARSLQEARDWFEANGLTVTQWAREHGFSASVVYALLSGRTHGRRGDAHRAALALGLKLGALPPAPSSFPTAPQNDGPVARSRSREGEP